MQRCNKDRKKLNVRLLQGSESYIHIIYFITCNYLFCAIPKRIQKSAKYSRVQQSYSMFQVFFPFKNLTCGLGNFSNIKIPAALSMLSSGI